MIPLLYLFPSLWAAILLGLAFQFSLGWALHLLPKSFLFFLTNFATGFLIFGVVLGLLGVFLTATEQLKNNRLPRNFDAVLNYAGGVFVILAFILEPTWPRVVGLFIFVFLIVPALFTSLVRTMETHTSTLFGSLGIYLVVLLVLGGFTWLIL